MRGFFVSVSLDDKNAVTRLDLFVLESLDTALSSNSSSFRAISLEFSIPRSPAPSSLLLVDELSSSCLAKSFIIGFSFISPRANWICIVGFSVSAFFFVSEVSLAMPSSEEWSSSSSSSSSSFSDCKSTSTRGRFCAGKA